MDRRLLGNADVEFDPAAGTVRVRSSGQFPAVLHFSGSANSHCKEQWAGYLGLFSDTSVPASGGAT
jgi:hypothetical protein